MLVKWDVLFQHQGQALVMLVLQTSAIHMTQGVRFFLTNASPAV